MMNREQRAEQFRRAVQMFIASLDDTNAMEVATVYPSWQVGKSYVTDDIFRYGTNNVGDPQLYRVVKDHTSQADWLPNVVTSLYVAIGLNEQGYPKWSRPTGSHDCYDYGDIVDYEGTLYKSLIDGNTYSPTEYPQGWEVVE